MKTSMSFHKFLRSEQGSALPLVGLGLMMLLAATGIAIDMGRAQLVQAKMSNALDAAGLAAGATISTTNPTSVTTNYFYANFPTGFMGTTINSLTATPNSDNSILTLNVQGTVNTTFMKLFGVNSMAVSATSQITRASKGMELVLVLDNTGSMNCEVTNESNCSPTLSDSKINALKTAANELLDILYGSNTTIQNLWVGVVPFTQTVNIGTSYSSWMNTSYDNSLEFGPIVNGSSCQTYTATTPSTSGTYSSGPKCAYTLSSTGSGGATPTFNNNLTNWAGCVMARPSPYDISDDVPSTASFQAYDYPYTSDAGVTYSPWKVTGSPQGQNCTTKNHNTTCSSYNTTTTYNYSYSSSLPGYYGPNLFCPQPVTPMVAEKATVSAAINAMTAGGSTLIDIGMAWGYRMLSPNWQGLWGGEMNANNLPLAYNTPLMNKVLILMTDGENEFDPGNYTAYQYLDSGQLGTTNFNTANSTLDTRTLSVCSALKNNGVIIYTIGFGTTSDVNSTLLQSCASNPSYFFLAPTNAELESDFQQIGDSLANLRISQ